LVMASLLNLRTRVILLLPFILHLPENGS
jgi:hypothetical protein